MPVNTTPNNSLSLTLGSEEYNCQVTSLDFSPPGYGAPSVVEVACPDGVVHEPGGREDGTLTGEVYTDLTDTGLTWILATARDTDSELTYTLILHDDQPTTNSIQYTGTARVSSFSMPFEKPGLSKHSLDLAILTATMSRPA